MTGCENCNADCFNNITDGCVDHTSGVYPSLGITKDMNLRSALRQLALNLVAIQERLELCDLCNGTIAEVSTLPNNTEISLTGISQNSTTCAAQLSNINFSYTVLGGTNSVSIQYSMQDIVDALPTDYFVLKKELRAFGNSGSNTLYTSTTALNSAFTVEPSRFPIKLEFSLLIGSPCGTISLEKTVLINGVSNGTYSVSATVKDYGKDNFSNVTQELYNNVIKDKVITIERDLNNVKTLNVQGTPKVAIFSKDLDTVIQTLINKIDNLTP